MFERQLTHTYVRTHTHTRALSSGVEGLELNLAAQRDRLALRLTSLSFPLVSHPVT